MIRSLYDLDSYALDYARNHPINALRGDTTINEAPLLANPASGDIMPLYHAADGIGYGVSLATLASFIGTGTTSINTATSFGGLIYNYGNYVFQQLPSVGGTANTNAMNAMCAAMNNATTPGGEAWIPQVNYAVNFVSGGFAVADQTVMRALGTGGRQGGNAGITSYHFSAGGDGILFSSTGSHSSGGVQFHNLSVNASAPSATTTTAFLITTWGGLIRGCNIINFPVGAILGQLSGKIEETVIWYAYPNANSAPSGTGTSTLTVQNAIPATIATVLIPTITAGAYVGTQPTMCIIGGNQSGITGPGEWAQTPQNQSGPTNVVGVGIGNTAKNNGGFGGTVQHNTVGNIHISDFQWGISYCFNPGTIGGFVTGGLAGGGQANDFIGVHSQSYGTSVLMMAPTSGSTIFGEKYIGCTFAKGQNSADNSPVVYIDATTNGGNNNNVQDIEFTNCTIFNPSSQSLAHCHGYWIYSGTDIRIIGGSVSNMGGSGANIFIGGGSNGIISSGTPGRILINGTRLGATYPNAANINASSYALYVAGAPTQALTVQNCQMDGTFGVQPVFVGPAISSGTLYITNCQGYNDQNLVILSGGGSAPTSTTSASVTNVTGPGGSGQSSGYFGPSYIYGTNSNGTNTFTLNGSTTTLAANQVFFFFLSSPYDTFSFQNTTTSFHWIGK